MYIYIIHIHIHIYIHIHMSNKVSSRVRDLTLCVLNATNVKIQISIPTTRTDFCEPFESYRASNEDLHES